MPPPGFLKSNNNTEEWASWRIQGEEGGGEEGGTNRGQQ